MELDLTPMFRSLVKTENWFLSLNPVYEPGEWKPEEELWHFLFGS